MNTRILTAWIILLALLGACDSQGPEQNAAPQATAPQAASPPAAAPPEPKDAADPESGGWQNYNRRLNGMRYSPLDQINAGNVTQLQQVWSHAAGGQATPIVIAGVMYVPVATGVAALNADTGEEV